MGAPRCVQINETLSLPRKASKYSFPAVLQYLSRQGRRNRRSRGLGFDLRRCQGCNVSLDSVGGAFGSTDHADVCCAVHDCCDDCRCRGANRAYGACPVAAIRPLRGRRNNDAAGPRWTPATNHGRPCPWHTPPGAVHRIGSRRVRPITQYLQGLLDTGLVAAWPSMSWPVGARRHPHRRPPPRRERVGPIGAAKGLSTS
jgi:hypothetical protein